LGAVIVHGHITPLLDLQQLLRETTRGRSRQPVPNQAGQSPRILIVDDTQFFRDLVSRLLLENGYAVATADDGAAALELLQRESFDMVVSDLEMPVMDGWMLASHVRQSEALRDIPLVALTTLAGEDARTRSMSHGFDAHEVKLDRGSLLATVQELLEQRRGRAETKELSHA
jgi:two-component system chemotaxis sensor kinase CheA